MGGDNEFVLLSVLSGPFHPCRNLAAAMDHDQRRKIAAMCWKTGSEAMVKQNWDYAIEMFGKAVNLVPDNLMYRQTLRGSEMKKYKDNGKGAAFAGTKLLGIRGRITKARSKEDWKGMDEAAEEGLKVNPWDAALNAALGEATHNLGYLEVAEMGYSRAVESEPENLDYLRTLARLLEERGNFSTAIGCWERVYKLDPLDSEARSKQTQLQARAVMEDSYDSAKTTQEARKKSAYDDYSGSPVSIPTGIDGPGVSTEADLQRAIRKQPDNVQNYLKLGDFYKREKRLEDAAAAYKQALDVSGGDPNVREQLEDAEIALMKHNLDLAKERAGANAEDESARKATAALSVELLKREIQVLSSRVERYPQDMRYRHELAGRFMRVKQWRKAIPLLQQASTDSRLAAEVCVALCKCFIQDGQKSLAVHQADKAIPLISPHDNQKLFCEAHYLAGWLKEDAGKLAEAEKHYTEVMALDYGYRDVRKRIEHIQSDPQPDKA